jgi:hypothetical protein
VTSSIEYANANQLAKDFSDIILRPLETEAVSDGYIPDRQ